MSDKNDSKHEARAANGGSAPRLVRELRWRCAYLAAQLVFLAGMLAVVVWAPMEWASPFWMGGVTSWWCLRIAEFFRGKIHSPNAEHTDGA